MYKAPSLFNHVALAVENLDEAVAWYKRHFALKDTCLSKLFDRSVEPDSHIFKLYEPSLEKVKVAWLSNGNGVGLEFFEFIEPRSEAPKVSDASFNLRDRYRNGGFFHICLTVPDPIETAKGCVKDGGAMVGECMDFRRESGEGPVTLYVRDPWGNVIELLNMSFEMLLANR